MAISIRLATTGEELFTEVYDPLDNLRVWKLRRKLRTPIEEEEIAIGDCIQLPEVTYGT